MLKVVLVIPGETVGVVQRPHEKIRDPVSLTKNLCSFSDILFKM